MKVFISFEREPTPKHYQLGLLSKGNKHLELKPGEAHYHPKGTYYILVKPDSDWVQDYLQDNHYKYGIKYTLDDTVESV